MKQVETSYEELEQEMITEFLKLGSEGLYNRGILATSAKDYVTARRMRFIPNGLTLFCWTATNARKHKQINENPNVAVVLGFIQIEGVASVKKHPLDEPEFLELYKAQIPEAYERSVSDWRSYDQVLIEIIPRRIAVYKYPDIEAGRIEAGLDLLNVRTGKAYRITGFERVTEDHSDIPAYNE